MYVEAHELFERFVEGLNAKPEASVVHSLAEPPKLELFLEHLDPSLSLDWSGKDFQGLPSLREKVLQRTGTDATCTINNVLITAGTAEANFLSISQLVQPGDEIIVDTPGWPQPLVLGNAIGASIKKLERREDMDWHFDMNTLEDLISSKTKLIFICNPNNPTGQVLKEKDVHDIVALADRVGAYVLFDEVYADLNWGDEPLARVANYYERGISTGSVSKALGLQGIRTGWLICRDKSLVHDAVVLREDTSEIMNIMGEAIADIALDDDFYVPLITKAREAGLFNLDLIDTFIKRHEKLDWNKPAAGLIGFCRLGYNMSSIEFAERLMQPPYRTFVMPGSAYGYMNHLRLGFGGKAGAELEEGLNRMADFVKHLGE